MRILPVIDLKDGHVVSAVEGRRELYRPLRCDWIPSSHPVQVAAAIQAKYALREFYVADLNAIERRTVDWDSITALIASGVHVFLDAGIASVSTAVELLNCVVDGQSIGKIIVATETLAGLSELRAITEAVDPARIVFSLDLRNGRVRACSGELANRAPLDIAAAAYELGITRFIVLDVARVGTRGGVATLPLVARLRAALPKIDIFTGGGARDLGDLLSLRDAGCAGALVATALYDGTMSVDDVRQLEVVR